MTNKHLHLYAYLAWLLLVSYSQHISYNPLLVLFSPLGLIPGHYLFSGIALAVPLAPLIALFAFVGAGVVSISVLAWHSPRTWVHFSYWILTIWFAAVLALVDRIVNREQGALTASLIASWTPGLSSRTVFLLCGFGLLGLAVLSLNLFRKNQIGRTGLITFLSSCLIVAWLIWCIRVPRFEFTKDYSEGLAAVRVYSQWGYVDTSLRVVIPPRFSYAWPFTDGLARVNVWSAGGESGGGYVDKTGRVVLQMPPGGSGAFWEGLALVCVGSKYGFIDKTGAIVIPPRFDGVRRFSEGRAAVLLDSKLGFIDKSGRMVILPRFDAASEFSEGLAPVRIGNQWGFIDREGHPVVCCEFSSASGFNEGLAAVSINVIDGGKESRKFGYIDKTGRFVISAQFEDAADFSGQVAEVMLNGRRIVIDKSGRPRNP
jgi:WG containing repeat